MGVLQTGRPLCTRQTAHRIAFASPPLTEVLGPLNPRHVPSPMTLWEMEPQGQGQGSAARPPEFQSQFHRRLAVWP